MRMPSTYKLHYLLAMKLGSGGETIISHGQKSQHGSKIFTLLLAEKLGLGRAAIISLTYLYVQACSSMIFIFIF